MGTNPTAITGRPAIARNARQVFDTVDRAYKRLRSAGVVWCDRCGDEGMIELGRRRFGPCDDHRHLTYSDALVVLEMPP